MNVYKCMVHLNFLGKKFLTLVIFEMLTSYKKLHKSRVFTICCCYLFCSCFSCVQAIPPVTASVKNASCIYYTYTGGFCKNIVNSLYVYGDSGTLRNGERETNAFKTYFELFEINDECRPLMRDLYCRYHFPPCDTSLDKPRSRKICRRTCEYLDQELCKKEMIAIRDAAAKKALFFDQDMINCSLYDVADGGDAPECYQYYPIPGE